MHSLRSNNEVVIEIKGVDDDARVGNMLGLFAREMQGGGRSTTVS